MTPGCPLCGGNTVFPAVTVNPAEIARIYDRLFAIDTSDYFRGVEKITLCRCGECGLRFYHPAPEAEWSFYDLLQKFYWYYAADKSEFSFAWRYIRSGDSVLEVGCGRGLFARQVAGRYVGLELNQQAAAKAVSDGHTVHVMTVEEHARDASGTYDVVCSFQVLEHVGNPGSFIGSCAACLKDGGLLILSVPSEDSYLSLVEDGVLNMPPHHQTRWPDATLKWLAEPFGLEMVELWHEPLADIHLLGYATETIRARVKSLFRVAPVLAGTTVPHRAMTFFCQIAGRVYSRLLGMREKRPIGHSVAIVLKKVSNP